MVSFRLNLGLVFGTWKCAKFAIVYILISLCAVQVSVDRNSQSHHFHLPPQVSRNVLISSSFWKVHQDHFVFDTHYILERTFAITLLHSSHCLLMFVLTDELFVETCNWYLFPQKYWCLNFINIFGTYKHSIIAFSNTLFLYMSKLNIYSSRVFFDLTGFQFPMSIWNHRVAKSIWIILTNISGLYPIPPLYHYVSCGGIQIFEPTTAERMLFRCLGVHESTVWYLQNILLCAKYDWMALIERFRQGFDGKCKSRTSYPSIVHLQSKSYRIICGF